MEANLRNDIEESLLYNRENMDKINDFIAQENKQICHCERKSAGLDHAELSIR